MSTASRPPFLAVLRRRPLVAALAAALTLLVAFALPAVSSAADKAAVTDLTWGTSNTEQTKTVSALSDLGAKSTRISASWYWFEQSRGVYDAGSIAATDRAVQLAQNAGIKVLMMVNESPQWASGSTDKNAPPRNPADYANFVQWLSHRYAGKVTAYEVWNEENISRFWPAGPNASQYATLLKAAYPAIKTGDPNAQVVFGGLSTNDYNYLEAAYAAAPNLGNYFDVMATHPYTADATQAPETIQRDPNGRISQYSFPGYREIRASMLARGNDKPIWFTEFGWATYTGGVSQTTQADYLTRAYHYIEQDPYVQIAYWYNLRNNYWANNANDWEDQLGLTNTDFTQKPAYTALKTYTPNTTTPTAGSGTTTTPPPTSTTPKGQAKKSQTSTTLRVNGRATATAARTTRRARKAPVVVNGRVLGAGSGVVMLLVQRRTGKTHRYHTAASLRVTLDQNGGFVKRLSASGSGAWRVQATYSGSQNAAASASRFAYFKV
jgi:hypothetical protein